MYRDRDDLESTPFGGQTVQEHKWVDFPPSPKDPSRVPPRVGRAVVLVPAHLDEVGRMAKDAVHTRAVL
jgi:hypothetical protein